MRETITLFMWGYQSHFRANLEIRAEKILQTIAPTVRPRALLVGIRIPGHDAGYPVCVEPEDGEWDPTLFFDCASRADAIYKSHPDHRIHYGDEPSMRDKPENIRKKSVLEAVKEITSAYDTQHATIGYCGSAGRVAGYHVVPVLQFENVQVEAYPSLPTAIRFQDWTSPLSFLDSTIMCILSDATSALAAKDPGRSIHQTRTDVPAVLRRAADLFCSAIMLATTDVFFQDVFDALNVVSSLPYEGEGAVGEILFAPPQSEHVETRVRFDEPVALSRQRLARKVIEMSGHGLSCICHGSEGVCGLGSASENAENVFRVVFTGHYKWDLYFGQLLLMRVAFGVPKLPLPRLSAEQFYSTARRVFENLDAASEQRLWALVETSMEQQHGTILVVSGRAAEEGRRLEGQAIGLTPTELTPDLVRRLSGIDGAILVSPKGVCHSIGVILDGIATDYGDVSRGARYNSAARYFTSSIAAERPTMCVVISADGYVDMIPNLLPQLPEAEIALRVNALKAKDISNFHKTIIWLNGHRFYLTPLQCEVVNSEIARIYSAPMKLGELRIEYPKFVPHPGMNESYYLRAGQV
jgi:hypothetical protein